MPSSTLTPMTTPLSHSDEGFKLICTCCGGEKFFWSEMEPAGMFCTECGTPDPITQATLETEEPGYWAL